MMRHDVLEHNGNWADYKICNSQIHYYDVIIGAMASEIMRLTIICSTVYSGADQSKKSKLRVTGLCAGTSPGTREFPAQMASNTEDVSIWWRHQVVKFHLDI